MKHEALIQRAEAQHAAGNISSARTLFDHAQSAAPDDETRAEIRDRARELGLYGGPSKPKTVSEPDVFVSGGKYDDGPYEEEPDAGSD